MKNSAVVFSIFIVVIITLFLIFSIFGILYFYWGDVAAVKDSLSIIASFFGGFATLGAAVIAAYLYIDWRVVKQYDIILNYVMIIKKQVQDLINLINNNRANFIKYRTKIKSPNLTLEEFKLLQLEILEFERDIITRLNLIGLDMNELYFLKKRKPQDPLNTELIKKIQHFNFIGIHADNYYDVFRNRLTTTILDEYFYYITDELTSFVYDEIMTQYLDDLILKDK